MNINIPFVLMLFLNGCSLYQENNKTIIYTIDPLDHCSGSCIYVDYLDFAERVTHKMLRSQVLESLKQNKAKVRVGRVENNSQLDKKNALAIYEIIVETILNTKELRVMAPSADSYDYTLNIELSKIQKTSSNNKLIIQKLELMLKAPNGKIIGHWSETIKSY